MAFRCPRCSEPDTLEIVAHLELPADNRSDDIWLQATECSKCGFGALVVYEESRRGSLDDDSFEHLGYHVPPDELRELKRGIKSCPDQANWRCECEAHQRWGRQNERGRWAGLSEFTLGDQFWMHWSGKVR